MDGRKRVLLADSSKEFRWLMWRSAANHNFFSLATVGSGCCFANKLRKIFIQSAKKKRRLKGF